MDPALHTYWRSTAAYRVRIALNFKNVDHKLVPISLVKNGGEHRQEQFRDLNPQMRVPFYQEGSFGVGQSMAILEYLEETHPAPPLLPTAPHDRAKARQIAHIISCDIHPLNNMGVLNYLSDTLNISPVERSAWYSHWITEGFAAIETLLRQDRERGNYCVGNAVSFADVCLIPQLFNAHRFEVDVTDFPLIQSVADYCNRLDAFARAHPDHQPDAERR